MPKVLIVDDDTAVTNYLMVFLTQTDKYDSTVLNDSRQAPGLLGQGQFDAVLLDLDMPNLSGMDILQSIRDQKLEVPAIVLTGVGDVELAVRSMKLGAFDYLTKPVDEERLLQVLDAAIQQKAISRSISQLPEQPRREDLARGETAVRFPTQDPATIRTCQTAEQMAAGDFCIFIWGERGTYKELLARSIHAASPRQGGPFVSVDVAAREPGRFAGEFFGRARDWNREHDESPGLLETAAGGTLFLDEIDLLPMPVQVRLRRLIQTGEFYRENSTQILKADVRLIVASHRDLTQDYYKDAFLSDLLYHLMRNSVRIPALHERPDDVPLLAGYFLRAEAAAAGKQFSGLAPGLLDLLKRYDFPDNLRELKGIVAAAVANQEGGVLGLEALAPHLRDTLAKGGERQAQGFRPRKLAEVAREHAARTLAYFNNDHSKAAQSLGVGEEAMDAILGGRTPGGR